MKARLTWTLGAVAAVLALGALFLLFFERAEVEVGTGPSRAARENHLLAAERLFQKLGVEAKSVRGAVELPAVDHVLVLSPLGHTPNRKWHQDVFNWVRRGGHLILGHQSGTGVREVLDPLAVELRHSRAASALGPVVLELPVTDGGTAYEVEMRRSPRLGAGSGLEPDFVAGGDRHRAALLRYRLGEGRVTVLADPGFLHNESLGRHQHASFAWALVTTPSPPAGVWLVYQDTAASGSSSTSSGGGAPLELSRLLRGRAWMAALSLGLWLAAWLWYRGARFGPLLPAPTPVRRSLREHLAASGNFLYRHGEAGTLVAATRRALLGQAAQKHPAWRQLAAPPEGGGPRAAVSRGQIEYLARLAGLSQGAVARALEEGVGEDPSGLPQRGMNETQLTRTVIVLEEIRRSL